MTHIWIDNKAMPVIINDLDIQAFVDGELDSGRADNVREAVAADSALQKRYEQLVQQKKLIAAAWSEKCRNVH